MEHETFHSQMMYSVTMAIPDMPQAGRDGGEESGRRSPLAYRNGSQYPDQREIQGLRASAETVCAGLPDEETEGERRRTAQVLY